MLGCKEFKHLCNVNQNKIIKLKHIDKFTYIMIIPLRQCLLHFDRRTICAGSFDWRQSSLVIM